MPDALLVSSELAPKKAWTAVAMKTATHELTSAVQPGAALYGLESHMQEKSSPSVAGTHYGVRVYSSGVLASAEEALNRIWTLQKRPLRRLT
jgi:uncharacterized protein GlcG (DUF336 family)